MSLEVIEEVSQVHIIRFGPIVVRGIVQSSSHIEQGAVVKSLCSCEFFLVYLRVALRGVVWVGLEPVLVYQVG